MGQGLTRKRTGIGKISEDGVQDVSANGDVVNADGSKTEVNGSAVKTNADQTVAEAESETASAKKEKKKRKRFFFSLKRSRPGSGRKKKEKKEKQANHNTSTDSGRSNRSSLFMDEFQIPEDDGIDSVSLSSNEAENKKKNGDDVIRRSKRSPKDGKKSKKKKQKTEKKKGDKSKKKNSKEENETTIKDATETATSAVATTTTPSADDSLNVNESVEPLHASVEAAVDEAKTASQAAEVKSSEAVKFAEDDLVAAVTAVMDSKSPTGVSSEGEGSPAEKETSSSIDDKQTQSMEAVVNEEVVQPVEAVIQETAVTPDKADDSANQSLDENGKPIRVSLGPRLKTAILKKYSGASDVPTDSQRVTLTKPKIVDVPDPIPPARKNRARRTLSQTPSNTSGIDLNASTSSSITQSPVKETKPADSEVLATEISATAASTPEVSTTQVSTTQVSTSEVSVPEVSLPVVSAPEVFEPEVSVPEVSVPEVSAPEVSAPEVSVPEVSVPEVSAPEVSEIDTSATDASAIDASAIDASAIDANVTSTFTANVSESTEVSLTVNSENPLSKPDNEQPRQSDKSEVKDANKEIGSDNVINVSEVTSSSVEDEEGDKNEDISTKQSASNIPEIVKEVTEIESAEASSGTDSTDIPKGLTLAEQAQAVVQQVIERSTSSLAESEPNTPTETTTETLLSDSQDSVSNSDAKDQPAVIESPISKEETSAVECSVDSEDNTRNDEGNVKEEAATPPESDIDKKDTNDDSDGFVLREMEIIVVGTRTYDEPEETQSKEKPEPVVIIERIHVEPYYGAERQETDDAETNNETEGKKQKYSKETGEVCKECLVEDDPEKKDTVPVTETVSAEVYAQDEPNILGNDETDVAKPQPCNDVADGLVASRSDGGDDSSSTATDSTVVEDDDPEKTLVAEEKVEKVDEHVEVTAAQENEQHEQDSEKDTVLSRVDEKTVSEESVKHEETSDKDNSESGVTDAKDSEQHHGTECELNSETDTENKSCEQDISENNNTSKELLISSEQTKVATITAKEFDAERLFQSEDSSGVKQ